MADLDDAEVRFLKPLVMPKEMIEFFEMSIRKAGDAL